MDSPQCRVVAIPLLKIQACFLQLWKESKSEIKDKVIVRQKLPIQKKQSKQKNLYVNMLHFRCFICIFEAH